VWLDDATQDNAYTMLMHAANESKRDHQAVKCISGARLDCATTAWDIMCERLDGRLFALSVPTLDNMIIRQRTRQSLTGYVHFMGQSFDE
jgi:hypothetical protein